MADSQLLSVHLEVEPRRDAFRHARSALQAACGDCTLAGDLAVLRDDDPGDGPTMEGPAALNRTYWLRDGDKLHPLSVGINSIGRLPDNSVVLRDEHVSRRHCAIVVHRDGRAEIHDVASKNGTVVNGRKIACPTRLHTGDQLTLCTRSLVFLTGAISPASAG